jgi:hypothetical protein
LKCARLLLRNLTSKKVVLFKESLSLGMRMITS